MEQELYPWRLTRDLSAALAFSRPVFAALGVIESGAACAESKISAAERRLQRPLPREVADFHREVRVTNLFSGDRRKSFGFYAIDSEEFSWISASSAEPAEDWTHAQALILGQTSWGDTFFWVEKHRFIPDGSIVLVDHEGGLGGNIMFINFARSLPEFIAKVAHFGGVCSPKDSLFRGELRELNPSGGF